MNETALSRALGKPHIAAELERRKAEAALSLDVLKGVAKASAYRVGIDLMHNSPDHKVRAKMVELFASEARQPTVAVQINNSPAQGYLYRKTDQASGQDDAQVIEGKAETAKPA
jgi:hypothetical protein